MREKFQAALRKMKKEQIVVWLLLLALVIVIFWPAGSGKETASGETEVPEQTAQEIQSQEEAMEQALADTLAQVDGVGAVRVALTLESTNRKIVEKDVPDSQSSETRTSGDETSENSSFSQEESTVYERDGSGAETPYVISEEYPAVRGVLIVAEGGDNPVVIQEIQEAVMALFGVDAHKIKVMKMKERSGG
ncbi:MAG TPA: stage III sporulation protein AG [Candidatus Fusicatenibacter intestinigallinarum]|uniref:Stage III sporulation protein AG n=1 Tax=Candidatus Fusicatenibacter intestinigallinarum TaxID=2838598 RepID=A0A9D2NC50_9FIRM|nr:stage III sporulation protein AG [Candidatus Fusicatenibacter intestinigallinarum]